MTPKADIEPVATLVERLKTDAAWCDTRVTSTIRLIGRDCAEAASALLALEGERDALREALKPFVDLLSVSEESARKEGRDPANVPDEQMVMSFQHVPGLNVGHFRRARAALSSSEHI
jgi:hypothetical protein